MTHRADSDREHARRSHARRQHDLSSRALAPRWSSIGGLSFRHGERFYNFRGLREYQDKFDPVWEPKYLASPGGLALPRILEAS